MKPLRGPPRLLRHSNVAPFLRPHGAPSGPPLGCSTTPTSRTSSGHAEPLRGHLGCFATPTSRVSSGPLWPRATLGVAALVPVPYGLGPPWALYCCHPAPYSCPPHCALQHSRDAPCPCGRPAPCHVRPAAALLAAPCSTPTLPRHPTATRRPVAALLAAPCSVLALPRHPTPMREPYALLPPCAPYALRSPCSQRPACPVPYARLACHQAATLKGQLDCSPRITTSLVAPIGCGVALLVRWLHLPGLATSHAGAAPAHAALRRSMARQILVTLDGLRSLELSVLEEVDDGSSWVALRPHHPFSSST